ncbi:MAG: dipicolinate synthase subunit DpsA [Oscillospiraceae bacterium]|nr:dipicolinate synthase subunit DpsA [Oscillospiraceae bacterium]
MKFAVTGGDMRQAKLAELLVKDGHSVSAYGVERLKIDSVTRREKLSEAVRGADCIVLPLPALSSPGVINTPFSGATLTVNQLLSVISDGQIVCAGRVTEDLREAAEKTGAVLCDYFAREELVIANALSTAEGAVQIIMEETPCTLSGARCLVAGFGRIGKLLANRLKAMGAVVTVSARKHSDIAWITALGYGAERTDKLQGRLSDYNVIINTVPARVFDETLLRDVSPDCLCIDLASKPGGIDFKAASELGLRVIWALSLPGEVAPVTAAMSIRDAIYNILREKEVEV